MATARFLDDLHTESGRDIGKVYGSGGFRDAPSPSPENNSSPLSARSSLASSRAAQGWLAGRLTEGTALLVHEWEELQVHPDLRREERFLRAVDRWCALEAMLRFVYAEEGCVLGGGCPNEAPVVCQACAREDVADAKDH